MILYDASKLIIVVWPLTSRNELIFEKKKKTPTSKLTSICHLLYYFVQTAHQSYDNFIH